ncbi:Phospholipase A1-II 1 [Porphyridium purpureum]|uniref:Phospholipase A1-II 1 n=1 Tax=Porphyridium purpureum TaxID=35688 RepID=A0A5J4YV93_PORPP|nr:Phospholipase A1-II 1 [Porphyridium purpureum]|eukprot:POR4416..scf227_4
MASEVPSDWLETLWRRVQFKMCLRQRRNARYIARSFEPLACKEPGIGFEPLCLNPGQTSGVNEQEEQSVGPRLGCAGMESGESNALEHSQDTGTARSRSGGTTLDFIPMAATLGRIRTFKAAPRSAGDAPADEWGSAAAASSSVTQAGGVFSLASHASTEMEFVGLRNAVLAAATSTGTDENDDDLPGVERRFPLFKHGSGGAVRSGTTAVSSQAEQTRTTLCASGDLSSVSNPTAAVHFASHTQRLETVKSPVRVEDRARVRAEPSKSLLKRNAPEGPPEHATDAVSSSTYGEDVSGQLLEFGSFHSPREVDGDLDGAGSNLKKNTSSLSRRASWFSGVFRSDSQNFVTEFEHDFHPFLKLEVIRAREVSVLLRYMFSAIFCAVVYAVIETILGNTYFLFEYTALFGDESTRVFRVAVTDPNSPRVGSDNRQETAFAYFNNVMYVLGFAVILFYFVAYVVRILRLPRTDRVPVQWWSIMQMLSGVLFLNPYDAIKAMIDISNGPSESAGEPPDGKIVVDAIFEIFFGLALILYPWAVAHTFRLNRSRKRVPISVWGWKLAAVLVLSGLKITYRVVFETGVSTLPFITFLSMLFLFGRSGIWQTNVVIVVSVLTACELAMVFGIFWTFRGTAKCLNSLDYMRTRPNQIGFRLFRFHTALFFAVFYIIYLLLVFGWPLGSKMEVLVFMDQAVLSLSGPPVVSLYIMVLEYFITEAWCHLPPTSADGISGWFVDEHLSRRRSSLRYILGSKNSEVEQANAVARAFAYRERERLKHGFPRQHKMVFCMETQVKLFNFAWLAYSYFKWDFSDVAKQEQFELVEYIGSAETDTHFFVIQARDRIVVAARGTSSLRNVQTDVAIRRVRLGALMQGAFAGRGFGADVQALLSVARVHAGFAEAYKSVRERLLECLDKVVDACENAEMPMYFTGHSMGGSLATLTALEASMRYGPQRPHRESETEAPDESVAKMPRQFVVSVFGAPRVGNHAFKRLYEAQNIVHWRVNTLYDIVPTLPKFGYEHVGRKAVFNERGFLLLDPSGLEVRALGISRDGLLWHRKSSYMLSMFAWQHAYHGNGYEAGFWAWISDEERVHHSTWVAARTIDSDTARAWQYLSALVQNAAQPVRASGEKRANPQERWKELCRRLVVQADMLVEEDESSGAVLASFRLQASASAPS